MDAVLTLQFYLQPDYVVTTRIVSQYAVPKYNTLDCTPDNLLVFPTEKRLQIVSSCLLVILVILTNKYSISVNFVRK